VVGAARVAADETPAGHTPASPPAIAHFPAGPAVEQASKTARRTLGRELASDFGNRAQHVSALP